MKKQAVLVMLIELLARSVIRGKMRNNIEANKIRNLLYEMSKMDKQSLTEIDQQQNLCGCLLKIIQAEIRIKIGEFA